MKEVYSLGIDPAKRNFTACLLTPDGKEAMPPKEFTQDRDGYAKLAAELTPLLPQDSLLFAGVEASAALDDNLLAHLREIEIPATVTVMRLDAAQVKHFHGPRPVRGKTDRADARRIARFTATFADQLDAFEQDQTAGSMAAIVNERLELVHDITSLKNRLKDRLIPRFPEFEDHFPDPFRDLPMALLEKAPTAAHMARLSVDDIINTKANTKGARHLDHDRAAKLLADAKRSIASKTTDDDGNSIRRLIARLRLLLEQLDEIHERLDDYIASDTDQARQIQTTCTLPGLSDASAATIVLRSRGVSRFHSAKAFAAQLAASPDRHQTGHSSDHGALSRRGDRRARPLLFMAAMTAARVDPTLAFHSWRLQQNERTPKQGICAVMNRLARLIWTLNHNKTTYDPSKGIDNAMRHHPVQWREFLKQNPKMAEKAEGILANKKQSLQQVEA